MKNESRTHQHQQADYACATIDSEAQRAALKACAEYLDNPTDEGKRLVRNMLPALRELVESQKRAENICKAIKEITEPAIYAVKDEAGAFFKFSKESYTSKITDTRALFDRMIGGGIPAGQNPGLCDHHHQGRGGGHGHERERVPRHLRRPHQRHPAQAHNEGSLTRRNHERPDIPGNHRHERGRSPRAACSDTRPAARPFSLMMIAKAHGNQPRPRHRTIPHHPGPPRHEERRHARRLPGEGGGKVKWVKRTDTECILHSSTRRAGSWT